MNRYGVVVDGEVVNVVLWDGEAPFPVEGELVPLTEHEQVGIGWTREGGVWTPPPGFYPEPFDEDES